MNSNSFERKYKSWRHERSLLQLYFLKDAQYEMNNYNLYYVMNRNSNYILFGDLLEKFYVFNSIKINKY